MVIFTVLLDRYADMQLHIYTQTHFDSVCGNHANDIAVEAQIYIYLETDIKLFLVLVQ